MIKRIAAVAAASTFGMLGVLALAGPAGAQTPTVKVTSSTTGCTYTTHVTNSCELKVTMKNATPNDTYAVVECNGNLGSGDQSACDTTLGQSGGPVLISTSSTGTGKGKFEVLVSKTQAIGDGLCAPKDTCYLAVVEVASETFAYGPQSFKAAKG